MAQLDPLLTANLCLTKEDITDDAQKGGDDVYGEISKNIPLAATHPARIFFNECKNNVITTNCPFGNDALLTKFDRDIQAQINQFTINGTPIYKTAIPITGFVNRKNITASGEVKDILVRMMTDTILLEEGCAPFFCVKDNWGFKHIEENFILASFFDEGGRAIECGAGVSIRDFLTGIYSGRSDYTIDLTLDGLTTFPNSLLTAHWGPRGDGVSIDPLTTALLVLTDNEILFTLQINDQYVKCVFSYQGNIATGRYSNTSTKRPISYSITIVVPRGVDMNQVILACFSGNSVKNQWFNGNDRLVAAVNRTFFIILGRFILMGKAIGDASFVFSSRNIVPHPQGKRYSVATSDKALGLRCCINNTDVILVITRGGGKASIRYYLSIQNPSEPVFLPTLQTKTISDKKTKVKKKVEKKEKNIYTGINNKLKKKIDMLGRRLDGRSYRVQSSRLRQMSVAGVQKGGVEGDEVGVQVIWEKEKLVFDFNQGELISTVKENVASKWGLDENQIKIIINGKNMKNVDTIPPNTKKIIILGSKLNTQLNVKKDKRNTDDLNTTTTSRDFTEPTEPTKKIEGDREEDSGNPEYDFKNFTYEYLRQILDFFTNGVEILSEVKTTLSQLTDITTDTVIYDNSKLRIDKKNFNLDVKIICIDTVVEFLNLLVNKIKNEREGLVEIITKNIVKMELIFDIYNVLDNIPFSDTLLVPKPNTPEDMCGIPTTELFEGCVKILSYLDGIPAFKDFFKPIYDEIDKLNKTTGTTGKTYTINTIFSDADSQPITASSLQKRSERVPYIYLLHSVKTELEIYPQPDSAEYNAILNDITRLFSTESSKMEKYELYNEISKMLTKSCVVIEYYELLLMIVSSFIDDALIAIVVRNELFRFISIRGTYIFDIKIIEAFIDGLDVNDSMGSIIYNRGFDTIDALINVKEYFDGDLIDKLNDYGVSLKEIGDFMNNLISEIKEQDLTDEQIDQLISTSLEPIIQQLEQKEQIQQRLDTDPLGLKQEATSFTQHRTLVSPVLGGNNKHKSKRNANYRKKYKKFVNKYIVKKKRNKNKYNTKKSNKNKTRKNKKSKTPKSSHNNKTVKKTKRKLSHKSKFNSNHKSKHNKKVKTNYYNIYKHSKTQKH
jgi:DNA-binding transcriptional MerR regulator